MPVDWPIRHSAGEVVAAYHLPVNGTYRLFGWNGDFVLPGQQVTLRPQTNASQFRWSEEPGLDRYHHPHPVASPVQTTTYTLTATNDILVQPIAGSISILQ